MGWLNTSSSISGHSASGFGKVRACLCARVRVVPYFPLQVPVYYEGPLDGFHEGARHVPVMPWVAAEGGAFTNQPGQVFQHTLKVWGAGQWGRGEV